MKLSELANYVAEMEAELAYGSETSLLTGFVNEFCYVSDAQDSDDEIDDDIFDIWKDAYTKYQELEEAGEDFCISDCF